MSIRKRQWTTRLGEEKEAWIVDYTDQEGKRHIKTFQRKKEADDYRATVHVDIRRGVHTSTKDTVADAGKKWLADAEERLEPVDRRILSAAPEPAHRPLHRSGEAIAAYRASSARLHGQAARREAVRCHDQAVVGDLGSILADAQERGTVAQNVVRSLSRSRKGKRADQRHKRRAQGWRRYPRPGRDQGHHCAP